MDENSSCLPIRALIPEPVFLGFRNHQVVMLVVTVGVPNEQVKFIDLRCLLAVQDQLSKRSS